MRRIALASALVLALVSARNRAVHPAPYNGPTFSNEVVRIFQANCQTCHHPGDIGPFSLMTYADAFPRATDIKYMTQNRQMPPWKPAQSCGVFDSPRVLSQENIDTLARWVGARLSSCDVAAGNGIPASGELACRPAGPLSPARPGAAAGSDADRHLLREEETIEADARPAADQRHVHHSARRRELSRDHGFHAAHFPRCQCPSMAHR